MSVKSKERQKFQSDFLESGKEISVGNIENFPMSIEQLCSTQKDSPWVRKCFSGGLTAEVFKIECDGKFYTLKTS